MVTAAEEANVTTSDSSSKADDATETLVTETNISSSIMLSVEETLVVSGSADIVEDVEGVNDEGKAIVTVNNEDSIREEEANAESEKEEKANEESEKQEADDESEKEEEPDDENQNKKESNEENVVAEDEADEENASEEGEKEVKENARNAGEEQNGEEVDVKPKDGGRKPRTRNRRKKVEQKGSEIVTMDGEKPESSNKKKASKEVEGMGMIFMCSSKTKTDCFRYKILGLPAGKKDQVQKIYKGMKLFLFDIDLRLMYGIFKAVAPGGFNIEPKAFKSAFPSQVRFTVIEDCFPLVEEKFKKVLKENYYTRNKFDCLLNSEQVKKLCNLFTIAGKGPTSRASRKAETLVSGSGSADIVEDIEGVNDEEKAIITGNTEESKKEAANEESEKEEGNEKNEKEEANDENEKEEEADIENQNEEESNEEIFLAEDEADEEGEKEDKENERNIGEEQNGEDVDVNPKKGGRKPRTRNRRKKVEQKGSEIVTMDGEKPESSNKKKIEGMGMIFMCSSKTKTDCFRYKILGLPAGKKEQVQKIYKGMRLFLFDIDLRLMYGIFKAAAPGGYNIEPKAFKSAFPSQVRFTVIEDCFPLAEEKFKKVLKENYYARNKFDCQLNSEQVKKLCNLFTIAGKGPTFRASRKAETHVSGSGSADIVEDIEGVNDEEKAIITGNTEESKKEAANEESEKEEGNEKNEKEANDENEKEEEADIENQNEEESNEENVLAEDEADEEGEKEDKENERNIGEEQNGEDVDVKPKEGGRKPRTRNRRKKVEQKGSEIVTMDGEKPESSNKKKVEGMGMIFMCSSKTKTDCFRYKILGLPAGKKEQVQKIYKGMRLFLFDIDLRLMYGIFKATAPGGYNIEPKAFNSAFPSQVRFTVMEDCLPLAEEKFKKVLQENYYTRNKFDCQLTSEQVKKLCNLFTIPGKGPTFEAGGTSRKRQAHDEDRRPVSHRGKRYRETYESPAPLYFHERPLERHPYLRDPVTEHRGIHYMDSEPSFRDDIRVHEPYMVYRDAPLYAPPVTLPLEYRHVSREYHSDAYNFPGGLPPGCHAVEPTAGYYPPSSVPDYQSRLTNYRY